MKKKILFVLEFYHPHIGGSEFLFKMVAEEMIKNGHEVAVLTSRIPGSKKFEVVEGVNVHRVWTPRIASRHCFTFLALIPLFKIGRKYDIYYTSIFNAAIPASIVGRIFKKQVYLTVHEVWDKLWFTLPGMQKILRNIFWIFESFILSLPYTKIICISKSTYRAYIRKRPGMKKNVEIIYPGIDYANLTYPTVRTEQKRKKKVILFYGRPGVSKGVENLVKAFNHTSNNDLILKLIVNKDDSGRYAYINSLIESKNIVLRESLEKKALVDQIKKANYVIIPSLSEGFGYSALEACIYKKKIICSNQASLPEVVFGKVLFYNPWKTNTLTKIFNTLETQKFSNIPKKTFPIKTTVKNYLKLCD